MRMIAGSIIVGNNRPKKKLRPGQRSRGSWQATRHGTERRTDHGDDADDHWCWRSRAKAAPAQRRAGNCFHCGRSGIHLMGVTKISVGALSDDEIIQMAGMSAMKESSRRTTWARTRRTRRRLLDGAVSGAAAASTCSINRRIDSLLHGVIRLSPTRRRPSAPNRGTG